MFRLNQSFRIFRRILGQDAETIKIARCLKTAISIFSQQCSIKVFKYSDLHIRMYDALLANVIISVQLNGVLKSERAYSDAYLSQAMCNHAKNTMAMSI